MVRGRAGEGSARGVTSESGWWSGENARACSSSLSLFSLLYTCSVETAARTTVVVAAREARTAELRERREGETSVSG